MSTSPRPSTPCSFGTDDASARVDHESSDSTTTTALPADWDSLWGPVPRDPLAAKQLARLRRATAALADDMPLCDKAPTFSALVGATDHRRYPVHRWFAYKEAFSPALPSRVLDALGVQGDGLVAADFFGGVATTALALCADPRISETRSLEYSPLAHAIGAAKLTWHELDADRLRAAVRQLLSYRRGAGVEVPQLAAFRDPEKFAPEALNSLLCARKAVFSHEPSTPSEKAFFMVGIAAVVEDASNMMKDGRALRIRGARRRRPSSLTPLAPQRSGFRDRVKTLLEAQWLAMIEDIEVLRPHRRTASATAAHHVRGDVRRLRAARLPNGVTPAFPADYVDVAVYSPPYLNFIDYSEVYKLELWLLGHVTDQAGFRRLRLGTLRSHPSVRFGERRSAGGSESIPVMEVIQRLAAWLTEYGHRSESGPIVRQYFEDMLAVFNEQYRTLKPGAATVCVVANSTFSRRERDGGAPIEVWRLPVLTDVLLAHLARAVGFVDVQLWRARELRPRNVRAGSARESLLVAQKPR